MTQQPPTQSEPKGDSTLRWLWRFGLVRSLLALTFTVVTLTQTALEQLPEPTDRQWDLLGIILAFYFATAGAQGVAAQTAKAIRGEDGKEGGAG